MRFCSLGSGSTGNATLVEAHSGGHTTRVLIDCGFSQRELALRLARAGLALAQVDAIFITHEHGDHVGCALPLSRRHRIPLWMSRGSWRAVASQCDIGESSARPRMPASLAPSARIDPGCTAPDDPTPCEALANGLDGLLNFARDGEAIAIGELQLHPYTVPHDAREPLQLVLHDGASRLGVLTDTGCTTEHIEAQLRGCHGLLLECNHDNAMLAASAYPASLKARISGRLGHLSNGSAAQILAQCVHPGLRHVVAAHLSERNNSPALARQALAGACGAASADLLVADPLLGLPWLSLG